jgi:FtsH-binding integral membrane protein
VNTQLTRMYAVLVATLAIVGIFVSGHLVGLINVDPALDVFRIVLAAYLIYVGFFARNITTVNSALLVIGMFYIGLGVGGMISPALGGLLPSGVTGFDVAFHLITGALATYVASAHNDSRAALNS